MIPSPDQERALGIQFYWTDAPGCGGVIKTIAEDFIVGEVFEDKKYEGGRFLVIEVEKKNWDTHHLVRELSRQLRISQKRFGWAGTKDKKAVTTQRMSIMNLDPEEISKIRLPDVKLRVLGRTNRSVGLGDLHGNRFTIRLREMTCPDPCTSFEAITGSILDAGGLPNFFGHQRFGDTRPVTHKVGEALVRGDPEGAVFTYLAMPFPDELPVTKEARARLWEDRDVKEALRSFPGYLYYEIAIMNYLVKHPDDYAGSFDVLTPNLKHLFVHAYQSYIFNKILSARMAAGIPLNRALAGDVVCFSKGDLPDLSKLQDVNAGNIEAVNRLVSRGRAYVTLPLVGYESILASGPEGDIERRILDDEGVTKENFNISANPDMGSKGTRRTALMKVTPEYAISGECADLKFFLPAGCYATIVLREYTKGSGAPAPEKSMPVTEKEGQK